MVLRVVREHYGKIPLAVASGGTRQVIEMVLAHLAIRQFFAAVVTSEDYVPPFISLSGRRDQRFCDRNFAPFVIGEAPVRKERLCGAARFAAQPSGLSGLREP